MKMHRIVWWEIVSPDPELFMAFHTAVNGWDFIRAFSDTELARQYWIITKDHHSLGGLQRAEPHSPEPIAGTRVYFEVDDLEEALERVDSHGGLIERSRTDLGPEDRWFANYRDPSGVSIGLWTNNPGPSAPPHSRY